jgi:5'-nucleotidase (lipoprotein e(P4) family)
MFNTFSKNFRLVLFCCLFCSGPAAFAKTQAVTTSDAANASRLKDETVMALLWQQSAEYRAISYQTFNFARLQLEQTLRTYKSNKLPAIVLDVDETVLSNTHFAGSMIIGKSTLKDWPIWVKQAKAKPLPGALDFLNYANSQNVTIYYVTNRLHSDKDATIKNLKAYGFPQVKESHILFADKSNDSKEGRRQAIDATYEIIMLLGDQLTDLAAIFDHTSLHKRKQEVDKNHTLFATKYILLPNPTYGEWEQAIYNDQTGLTSKTMLEKRLATIKQ